MTCAPPSPTTSRPSSTPPPAGCPSRSPCTRRCAAAWPKRPLGSARSRPPRLLSTRLAALARLLWPASKPRLRSKPRLQTPPPKPPLAHLTAFDPFRRRAYDDLLEPFFKETILGCESEGGFGELDKEAGQVRLLDMLGDDDVKARFLESWSRGAGAAQVTPPAPSLHPACTCGPCSSTHRHPTACRPCTRRPSSH